MPFGDDPDSKTCESAFIAFRPGLTERNSVYSCKKLHISIRPDFMVEEPALVLSRLREILKRMYLVVERPHSNLQLLPVFGSELYEKV